MKRTLAITLLTLAFGFVAVGFASAADCTCSSTIKSAGERVWNPMDDVP